MAALNKNTLVSNSEQDDSLFVYLNTLSPLKTKKYDGVGATETLNSLGMDYSLITSLDVFYNKSMFLMRNNLLDKSNPEVSSEDVNKIYSHEEAPANSTHAWIDNNELQVPQFSSDDLKFLLGILDGPEPIEGGAYIREDNHSQPISAVDRNPVERVDDELARIRRGIQRNCQGYASEKTSLQRNNSVYTSNSSSCTTKSDERNKPLLHGKHTSDPLLALNQYKGKENEKMSSGRKPESPSKGISYRMSPAPMETYLGPSENEVQATNYRSTPKRTSYVQFEDITNQQLDQNRKRTMKVQGKGMINPASSGSNHEKEEESADLCQSIPQRKRKVNKSYLTREDGACKNCRCKKSKCLKRYCECFAAGVYCTGPCKCQDCSNKPIHKDTALQVPTKIESGKPLEFVPKVVINSDLSPQTELRK